MDAVSDRDFAIEFCAAGAVLAMHLSRLAEDVILWASAEFNFIKIADAYTTGSSLMPQKKNPDVAELTRGKTGRVYGNLMSLLTLLAGLPMTYNRDLQEDKERLFDTADTVRACVRLMSAMLLNTSVNSSPASPPRAILRCSRPTSRITSCKRHAVPQSPSRGGRGGGAGRRRRQSVEPTHPRRPAIRGQNLCPRRAGRVRSDPRDGQTQSPCPRHEGSG